MRGVTGVIGAAEVSWEGGHRGSVSGWMGVSGEVWVDGRAVTGIVWVRHMSCRGRWVERGYMECGEWVEGGQRDVGMG